MSKKKIFNDPIYGFISFPHEILYDLIDHPYFQRLRRIAQMGLSHFVYPGALHTRFHHALGSLHLITQAIQVLREKNVIVSAEESEAVSIAILLHDIGHGPFSHALEGLFVNVSHEQLSLAFMETLNEEFNGQLSLAMEIFKGNYPRKFLHQLVSSQLDMDRMDYLTRDSFFTGVAEGVISYDRIIKMLNVRNDELVVEQKGIFSIEKFLLSRKLMYWQVYLHKTSIISEQMLRRFVRMLRDYLKVSNHAFYNDNLSYFLTKNVDVYNLTANRNNVISKYADLDDFDIYVLIKKFVKVDNFSLNFIANGLLNRKLFKIELSDHEFTSHHIKNVRDKIQSYYDVDAHIAEELTLVGTESNLAYHKGKDEIKILTKEEEVIPYSLGENNLVQTKSIRKHFLCYPKEVY
ncbi:HD domain-containing protein [Portibacter marinus]|uniref:HD domain-containing protein n=1 Tax=Portibacter marinus TaxID=2898660 RepID=UPI001F270059|nr:HD domain-containing protein [Portibacter marinus]